MNFYTYPWWKAVVIPTIVKGEEFYDDGKAYVLDQVDIIAQKAAMPFAWIKNVLILVAIIMVARILKK